MNTLIEVIGFKEQQPIFFDVRNMALIKIYANHFEIYLAMNAQTFCIEVDLQSKDEVLKLFNEWHNA